MTYDELSEISICDIENHKIITDGELVKDISKLKNLLVPENTNCFYGNPFLYHYQLENLMRCRRGTADTIYEIYQDPIKLTKLLKDTKDRDRGGKTISSNIYECYRINRGSVVMFKSSTAKYIYKKYNATSILDPTAGWGGRMLGAWALDIDYVGIDTNIEMKQAYTDMIQFLSDNNPISLFDNTSSLSMIWDSFLNVDFSKIDYDFVLTSPPYINMEIYEHMTEWDNDAAFYNDFFLPLWEKSVKHIKKGGKVCLNISPEMYENAVSHGLSKCDMEEDLLQQLGQATGKKKQDKIYIWQC